MSDHSELVERLEAWSDVERAIGHVAKSDDFEDAANAIKSLMEERAMLVKALGSFAQHASNFDAGECDDHPNGCPDRDAATFSSIWLTVGDFRRARTAIATVEGKSS